MIGRTKEVAPLAGSVDRNYVCREWLQVSQRKRPTKQCTCQAQSPSEKIVPWSGCVFLRAVSKIHGHSEKIH